MIQSFKSIQDIAKYIADLFESETSNSRNINIAISGGNTPTAIFKIWAELYSDKSFWNKISFFWVDERCVKPDDSESNYFVAKTTLLEPLKIPKSNIYRIHGEDNPKIEAERYSNLALKHIPLYNNIPQFDIVLLGIGEDGHTASIFPGNEILFESEKIYEATKNPYSLQNRITLTGKSINNAKKVFFIITGEAKKSILIKIFEKDSVYLFPANLVKPNFSEIQILTDIQL